MRFSFEITRGKSKKKAQEAEPATAVETADMQDEKLLRWLGINSNKPKAVQEITYFTCLKMLSEAIAKMPIKIYQETDKGILKADLPNISYLLRTRPNPFMTPTIFWNTVEMNRNHHGNAYVYIEKKFRRQKFGGEEHIVALWIMPSEDVRVLVDDAGIFDSAGGIFYKYTDRYSNQKYVFRPHEVMHFKTSHTFDGIVGSPVRTILKETVAGASYSGGFLNRLFKQGLTAKAVLEYTGDLSDGGKEKLRKTFESMSTGEDNAGRILPIPLGFKITPLDIKLTDAQFFELRKYSALQIAGAFGVKPNQINDYEKSSYANSEMQQLSFYVDTELFILKQYEEEIEFKILSRNQQEAHIYIKFNEKVLLRTDSKTQMEILKSGVQGSIHTPNEARRKLDSQDMDGGDQLFVNSALIPITLLEKKWEKKGVKQ